MEKCHDCGVVVDDKNRYQVFTEDLADGNGWVWGIYDTHRRSVLEWFPTREQAESALPEWGN